MGWVAEEKFGSEAADFDASAADGVKEGDVGRGAKSARDIVVKKASFRLAMGGTVELIEKAAIGGEGVGRMCEVSGG